MEYDKVNIGNRIYLARKNKGLKQSEVSCILNMSQSQYSKIELGKNNITLPALFKVAELLDVSIIWILELDDAYANLTSQKQLELEKFKKYLINKHD